MSDVPTAVPQLRIRLDALTVEGERLESEGLPFPTTQIRDSFEQAVHSGEPAQAAAVVKRGESLLARVGPDWMWVRELLRRADELRAIAQTIGVDVAHLDSRVGNPRRRLKSDPLSAGSLEKAAASASLALAVLNDAIPKFCLQEAQQLGASIRRARDRGEEVRAAAGSFSRLLQALQDQNLSTAVQRLTEVRKEVGRIPRAPALPAISPNEEDEILVEARNLARRLQRIKGKAQNAQSAARLMAQVRAAISEDRRYGTPEEEIEALWAEVDRLTREKKRATEGPALEGEPTSEVEEGEAVVPPGEESLPEEEAETTEEPEKALEEERTDQRAYPASLYVPYLPPDLPTSEDGEGGTNPIGAGRARKRSRPPP
jgi:HAMP domain-containing protein